MKQCRILAGISFLLLVISFAVKAQTADDRFITYTADLKKQHLQLYWKDDQHKPFGSIQRLKSWLEAHKQQLVFAMNGGMYKPDHSPLGLYIENGMTLSPLDTANGNGNFYLQPNGVFYITIDNIPVICKTADFKNNGKVKYATQSGPMLLIDGQLHAAFKEGSVNLNIRNGVGILPDGRVVFVMSQQGVNFYDFADYFKSLGCRNALYLDGFVSRMYVPEKEWRQLDGDFGVIVGVAEER